MFVGCNQLFAQSAGFTSPAELIGKSDYDMPWKAKAGEYIKTDQAIIASGLPQTSYEEEQPQKDGAISTVLVSKVPIFDQEQHVVGVLCIYMDISERKRMEKNLILAKEKAEAANEAKKAFLCNMRHDLRTPFSGILTLSQWMAENEMDTGKRVNLQCIADSAKMLLEYVNTLLDHAQMGVHGLEVSIKPINLKKMIEEALLAIMPAAITKQLSLVLHYAQNAPQIINTDLWRLQRIVLNLLGNAVKFTHEGQIEIEVDIVAENNQNVTLAIRVKDTGIGIPVEKREAIFEKFTRLEAAYSGKYPGAGLGLYDVRQLCHELGGDVMVTDNNIRGSVFTCMLPFTISPATQNAPDLVNDAIEEKVTKNNSTHGIQILLVEDQPIAAHVAMEILRSHGYTVDIADTGMKALEKLINKQYNIILMDVGLPDIDGVTLAYKIRQFELVNQRENTVIIALTAHQDEEYDLHIFDKVYNKPFSAIILDEIKQQYR
jgi:PAS domain S-box-containing protein